MINLRKATLEDLKTIHDIETLSFNLGSYPLFVLRQLFDISEDFFLVAEEDTKILGYALGSLSSRSKQGWVLSLGVHPEARGKQIGKKLATKLVVLLENKHCTEICLTVHPENKSALKIYKTLGFEIIVETDNYYLDSEMRLLLMRTQAINH